jgi:hypothetical protein
MQAPTSVALFAIFFFPLVVRGWANHVSLNIPYQRFACSAKRYDNGGGCLLKTVVEEPPTGILLAALRGFWFSLDEHRGHGAWERAAAWATSVLLNAAALRLRAATACSRSCAGNRQRQRTCCALEPFQRAGVANI